ncbi:VanZ family protein [Thauera mechernichensis]|uniref:VanZ family protein n=1 Tax=Thauera mechernichensis TaxID=82788 RepID=A0ABW3WFA7_9RHOO|nr:VanZ family protein [Thauera mechernichensis]MDG3064859.1 VanZ family protein [Thauera mechernichensis]
MAATLLLNLPEVRYSTLASVKPTLADEGLRRFGEPVLANLPDGFALSATNRDRTRGLAWALPMADGAQAVRVLAEVALDAVGEGEEPRHRAMLSVRMVDAQGKTHERAAFMGAGTQAGAVDSVILLLPETTELQLMAQLLRVPGTFSVSELRLSWLVERTWVSTALLALWVLWLVPFGALLAHWLQAARYRAELVLAFALVLAAVVMPGEWRDVLQQQVTMVLYQWLADWLGWSMPVSEGRGLSDYMHFLMFALLGAALAVARRDLAAWRLIGGLILLGAATEVLQFLVPGREGGWLDVGLDAGGAMLGVLMARLGFTRTA